MAKVNTYETLFILDSNHYARDPGGVAKQLEELIAENGGEVQVSRMWMEQKLAYPIDKHQKGTYYLIYFSMEGPNLQKLARAFALAEPVIRELTIKLDPRLVEPILANARGEHFAGPSGAEGGEDAPAEGEEAVAETADA
ncbi:30S ribosomal protein S6 [Rhodopirellula sp. JC740]|uniref:Small ribosomal subunit protein bS6 n=1 Tax=Rhodopirellula halodulae TaxID=2894198 RepID=A0ABS8NDU5_9BACT|nr:30S ribosomal protein S6 [Rhodopirellula sp. JC737]MCC9641730.1 30S ribosomal protein S6 [Rhodopirellula sp. JC740]MCC9654722.1 30S ribosomal protein S6 [Rhodopirellula sp. JC737]